MMYCSELYGPDLACTMMAEVGSARIREGGRTMVATIAPADEIGEQDTVETVEVTMYTLVCRLYGCNRGEEWV
jgi:hypothetical protein